MILERLKIHLHPLHLMESNSIILNQIHPIPICLYYENRYMDFYSMNKFFTPSNQIYMHGTHSNKNYIVLLHSLLLVCGL